MKVLEEGHIFELSFIGETDKVRLTFRNTESGKEHEGTSNQEVLRALISRMLYLQEQLPHDVNHHIIQHLRMALVLHEARALERKVAKGEIKPEELLTSSTDGHFIVRKD